MTKLTHDFEKKFQDIQSSHSIWENPLLIACKEGALTKSDCQVVFSQYYYFSKNFTRLLGVALARCDKALFRAELAENLWEEAGEKAVEDRHSEIYKRFLLNSLKVSKVEEINFEPFTKLFFKDYIDACSDSQPDACFAILSYATEAIVPRLYSIFKQGLLSAGLTESDLKFFNLHIGCDDAHADTLKKMALSYQESPAWFERCCFAIDRALTIRDDFFTHLYQHIKSNSINELAEQIKKQKTHQHATSIYERFLDGREKLFTPLYSNQDDQKGIKFLVNRYNYPSTVLDPRILTIPIGCHNELHSHAHESCFYIIQGRAKVRVDDYEVNGNKGDVIYVPRWLPHQTTNIGSEELIIFAVTDYKFTQRYPDNGEASYREVKSNVFQNVIEQ